MKIIRKTVDRLLMESTKSKKIRTKNHRNKGPELE
jgi:hypothetical protein